MCLCPAPLQVVSGLFDPLLHRNLCNAVECGWYNAVECGWCQLCVCVGVWAGAEQVNAAKASTEKLMEACLNHGDENTSCLFL